MLGTALCDLDQVKETLLTFFKTGDNRLLRELWKVLILHDEIMQVVPQVVSASGSAVAVENTEETYLRPLDIQICL